ncbi:MAG TPA: GNAT family N-acetyltransferase [Actinomycetota bacterium]|nr:GNAT family N-acetyltransferase [Actinomycetota bacterium]
MDVEIRAFGEDRLEEAVRMRAAAFGEEIHPEEIEVERSIVARSRNLAAIEGEAMVGSASSYPFELTVPGGVTLPAGGITMVGVLPTHRRRGLGRALMRRQLDELHDQGTPLAYLWASEGRIYQRFGYGLGAMAASFDIRRQDSDLLRPGDPRGRVRLVDRTEALKVFPSVYERVRPTRPGFIDWDEHWWKETFLDIASTRDGATPYFWAAYETGEGLDGYLVYRVKESDHRGMADNIIVLEELMAATDDAYAALWRYCFEVDLVRRVKGWKRPADEPLLFMLAEPRGLGLRLRDGTWLRLVDVEAALVGRRYAVEDRVVLEIRDEFCAWNEGRWLVEGGPDGATCRRADDEPDLVTDAATLAAAYLGAVPLWTLAAAGRVEERTTGALRRADAMFATDLAPWCPHIF